MSQQVVHLDFIALSPNAGPDGRQQIIGAAAELAALPQVETLGVIEADAGDKGGFDLVFYFQLPDFAALEPFGTHPAYAGFLQGTVASRLTAFAGADIRLDEDLSVAGERAACLALSAPEETYDWEVREALQAWCAGAGAVTSAVGVAVGEKGMYRGAALVFGAVSRLPAPPDVEKFGATLVSGGLRTLA